MEAKLEQGDSHEQRGEHGKVAAVDHDVGPTTEEKLAVDINVSAKSG